MMPLVGLVCHHFKYQTTLAIGILLSFGWLGSLIWLYTLRALGIAPSCLWGFISFIVLMGASATLEPKSQTSLPTPKYHMQYHRTPSFTMCLIASMILGVGVQPVLIVNNVDFGERDLLIPFAITGSIVIPLLADFMVGRYLMLLITSVLLGIFLMLGPNLLSGSLFAVLVG